jgi:hypothetical protein
MCSRREKLDEVAIWHRVMLELSDPGECFEFEEAGAVISPKRAMIPRFCRRKFLAPSIAHFSSILPRRHLQTANLAVPTFYLLITSGETVDYWIVPHHLITLLFKSKLRRETPFYVRVAEQEGNYSVAGRDVSEFHHLSPSFPCHC